MKKTLLLLINIVLLNSCINLDEEVYDNIPENLYPENDRQADLLTIGAYKELGRLVDNGEWWFAQEVTSDAVVAPTRLTDWDDGGRWRELHTHTWTNMTKSIIDMWGNFYNGITECNKALEYLGDSEEDKNAAAQMKILRSFYYYLLIDNYGDVPYVTSFSNAPSNPHKANRANIYDSLIQVINVNISNLADPTHNNKSVVNKATAYTLLAKLYLNAEVYTGTPQWQGALDACDAVINMDAYDLEISPLAPFVTNNKSSMENIFTIPFDEINFQGFNLHMRTLHYDNDQTFDMLQKPWNGFAAMEDHYDTYESGDLRKGTNGDGYFLVGQQYSASGEEIKDADVNENLVFDKHIPALKLDAAYTTKQIRMSGARVVKFEVKNGARENLSNDYPLFRYADVLLMKAEALIRLNGAGDGTAAGLLTKIRTRAGVGAITADLDNLLAERGREMFWEGHRRQDLIRFGKFGIGWWEKDPSATEREIFPIPQTALDANPNL